MDRVGKTLEAASAGIDKTCVKLVALCVALKETEGRELLMAQLCYQRSTELRRMINELDLYLKRKKPT